MTTSPPLESLAKASLQTSEEASWTPMIPTTYGGASMAPALSAEHRSAKTTRAALNSHPGHNTSTLMVKIRKMITGTDNRTEIGSARTLYPYPHAAIETEEAQAILVGSEQASKIGALFECFPGSAKIIATHTGSGRSTERTA